MGRGAEEDRPAAWPRRRLGKARVLAVALLAVATGLLLTAVSSASQASSSALRGSAAFLAGGAAARGDSSPRPPRGAAQGAGDVAWQHVADGPEQPVAALAWLFRRAMGAAMAVVLCVSLSGLPQSGVTTDVSNGPWLGLGPQPAFAKGSFASGQRVNRDPLSLLQTALPLEETLGENACEAVRGLQEDIDATKLSTLTRLWRKSISQIESASNRLKDQRKALLKPVDKSRLPEAEKVLAELDATLPKLLEQLEKGAGSGAGTEKDKEAAKESEELALKAQKLIGDFEFLMVPPGYKAPIAKDVDPKLPQLQGRAKVEFVLVHDPADKQAKKFDIDAELSDEAKFTIVLDGWTAPITAGNFMELVDKGFYTGMKIQRADGLFIQTGDPGKEKKNGYIPEGATKVRRIPLEVGMKGRKMALYGETVDEANLVGQDVKIPFQAEGTLSMARDENDNDSASSQIFIFLFESDMTPAGKNFLDGRYSTFGYTIEGEKFLRQVREGDIVKSAKIVDGLQNLQLTKTS